ncbi:GUN4 domain-containing protein [Crocosphaera sp.]|uniref:GUN4 domain-containing protein n=1 Tax=Crocosphaera sp. TaxID=2729996 RepID=UPI00262ABD1F|nr:GUN4 domain-containing protein [Crocosphaera sp.]MDJ0580728.1 GUN4 domain-containing protein [Crocosphaera sp.]
MTQGINENESKEKSISLSSVSDSVSKDDSLGFKPYVSAIAEFLDSPKTKPPLTLSIEGEWGSGKSSFMKQLQDELEKLDKKKQNSEFKIVSFNAWRHDKAQALWAAFAISFLQQISQPRNFGEVRLTIYGHIKLFFFRFNWKKNWVEFFQAASLSLFIVSVAGTIPILFFTQGIGSIQAFSDQGKCIDEKGNNPNPGTQNKEQKNAKTTPENKQVKPQQDNQGTKAENNGKQDKSSSNNLCGIQTFLLMSGGVTASATGVVSLLIRLRNLIGDPKLDLTKYLKYPNYDSQVPFIEKFHEDFSKIVKAYTPKNGKVYVFIDDLDRCELAKAADLMQAFNLMIANDPHIIFILGMDRGKVAASIALKQKNLLPYLPSSSVVLDTENQKDQAESKGLEYGYAFVEKFVQLPFQVPQPTQDKFEEFLAELSKDTQSEESQHSKESTPKSQENFFFKGAKWFNSFFRQNGTASSNLQGSDSTETNPLSNPSQTEEKRTTIFKVVDGKDSAILHSILKMVAPILDYNPRRFKQFVNLFRLKTYIASYTGLFDEVVTNGQTQDDLTLRQLAKFTAICLKYPLFQVDLEKDLKLLAKLENYALGKLPNDLPSHLFEQFKNSYDDKTKFWANKPQIVQLLRYGCDPSKEEYDLKRYSLSKIPVEKLLQVSPDRRVDYTKLRYFLEAGKWKEADKETANVMLKVTNRVSEGWLDVDDIENFPCDDLRTIDQLWVHYSNGKFGFSVQKKIYMDELGGTRQYNEKIWYEFCDRVGWRKGRDYVSYSDLTYELLDTTPVGHLPWCYSTGGYKASNKWVLFTRAEACRL